MSSQQVQVIEIPLPVYRWLVGKCSGFFAPGRAMTEAYLQAFQMPAPEAIGPDAGRWEDVEVPEPETITGGVAQGIKWGLLVLAVALAVKLIF